MKSKFLKLSTILKYKDYVIRVLLLMVLLELLVMRANILKRLSTKTYLNI